MKKAVILAAGKGSRLYPVTHHIAKPLLPIANRPTLFYTFDRLKAMGIKEVCIVVGENEAQMKAAIGDGSSVDLQVSYVKQEEPKGLAHAVGFAKSFVNGEPFALQLGDAIYSEGFQQIADRFREGGIANLNLVAQVDDPQRYGVANLNGDKIIKLVEKPQMPESNWVMAGLYFFGKEIWDVLPSLQPSPRGEFEITDAIQMLIDEGHSVIAGKYSGKWFDTGTRESFLDTNEFLLAGQNSIHATSQVKASIGHNVVVGENAWVRCRSLENCVVMPNATIDGDFDIQGSILGGGCILEDDLIDSIRWADAIQQY